MYIKTGKQIVFIFIYIVSTSADIAEPVVQTAQGLLRGMFLITYDGRKIYSFRGLRFAEPPIGANRFKPPVPVEPWSGIYNATQDGPVCLQPAVDAYGPASEDCLFLNVYTKKLNGKQPVIVFFHPGGYFSLTGRSNWFGPEYILGKDIVLITTNYRLGPLGFLCTEDRLLRGNYGMKDQVAVLRWVKQNIVHFGGDPDTVTIMGYSAGSASVMLHMLSPMSRGLFHRAIAMSGSGTSAWAINHYPIDLAQQLTNQMNCGETTTPHQIYECVKSADGQFMANITFRMRLWSGPRIALFGPVVEKDYEDGEERFLTDEPIKLIQQGEFTHVPLILGVTKDEFSYHSHAVVWNESLTEEFNKQPEKVMPRAFMYEREGARSQQITQKLRKFYMNDQPISNTTHPELGMIFRDALITFPQIQAAKLFVQTSTQPVYLYLFTYPGRYSFRYIPKTTTPIGVVHHDDLMYLFYISALFPKFNNTDPEFAMMEQLTSIWTDFAHTGLPELSQPNITWRPLTHESQQYLEIDHSLRLVQGVPFTQFMELWDSLFPVSGPHQIYY